jgi:hypothetical protein
MEIIGALIQDLAHSDSAKVNVALDALYGDLKECKNKCDSLITAGGCHALVQLVKDCLNKATKKVLACHRVTELNELAELMTLRKALEVIIILTFHHAETQAGIAAIGGVEAIVKAMKAFPKCQALQEGAFGALRNLACCSIGKKKVVKLVEWRSSLPLSTITGWFLRFSAKKHAGLC